MTVSSQILKQSARQTKNLNIVQMLKHSNSPSRLLVLAKAVPPSQTSSDHSSNLQTNSFSGQVSLHLALNSADLADSKECRVSLNILGQARVASLVKTLRKILVKRYNGSVSEVNFYSSNGQLYGHDTPLQTVFNESRLTLKINDVYIPVFNGAPHFELRQSVSKMHPQVGSMVFPILNWTVKCDNAKTKGLWFSSSGNGDPVLVSDQLAYRFQTEDIGKYIHGHFSPFSIDGVEGPSRSMSLLSQVQPEEPGLPLAFKKFNESIKSKREKLCVIATYNLLANHYITTEEAQEWYDYCPKYYRQVSYRPQRVLTEIVDMDADILLCQEFENFGYITEILDRQFSIANHFSSASKLSENYMFGQEGLATLYRKDKLKMIDAQSYVIKDIIESGEFEELKQIYRKHVPDDQLCSAGTHFQTTQLENLTNSDQKLFVVNVHLRGPPFTNEQRFFQILFALAKVNEVISRMDQKPRVIFGGDFNTINGSHPHKFLQNFSADFLDQDENDFIKTYLKIGPMQDVCHEIGNFKTNYTKEFKECIDYLFIGGKSQIHKVLDPTKLMMEIFGSEENSLVPNKGFVSDHLPVLAAIELL